MGEHLLGNVPIVEIWALPVLALLHGSGAIGDATKASAAKGEQLLEHGARAFCELLGEVDNFDVMKLATGPDFTL